MGELTKANAQSGEDEALAERRHFLRSAATMLGLSYRQTKRVWRRFRRRGARGLQHQSAGRSNRQITAATRKRALALIRQKYSGPAGTRSDTDRLLMPQMGEVGA